MNMLKFNFMGNSMLFKRPTIVTITAPTCAGKSTILNELCNDKRFHRVISFTTRAPRAGEKDGVDYYFMKHTDVENLRLSNQIAEYNVFGGFSYGVTKSELQVAFDSKKTPVVILDPNGVAQFDNISKNANISVFKVYVYCEEKTRIGRLNTRTESDLLNAYSSGNLSMVAKIISSHTNRVKSALGEERTWHASNTWNVLVSGEDTSKAISDIYQAINSYNSRGLYAI